MEDYRRAIEDFDAALRAHPDDTAALQNRAYAKFVLEDYGGAEKDWTRAVELDRRLARKVAPYIEESRRRRK